MNKIKYNKILIISQNQYFKYQINLKLIDIIQFIKSLTINNNNYRKEEPIITRIMMANTIYGWNRIYKALKMKLKQKLLRDKKKLININRVNNKWN